MPVAAWEYMESKKYIHLYAKKQRAYKNGQKKKKARPIVQDPKWLSPIRVSGGTATSNDYSVLSLLGSNNFTGKLTP